VKLVPVRDWGSVSGKVRKKKERKKTQLA